MTRRLSIALVLSVLVLSGRAVLAADITGKWTASFDTQIGQQNYTYDFVVKGTTLTGKAKGNLSEGDILEGKVDGDKVTFTEIFKLEGMEVRITYTGKIVSADEIAFTRQVADIATEEFVARRAK